MLRTIANIFPSVAWHIQTDEKVLFLTFDDGPIPEVTPAVLDTLSAFKAKATFFCIGENIKKNPWIFARTVNEGHAVGNHSYNHLNGWRTSGKSYMANTLLCNTMLDLYKRTSGIRMFRPPYGKLTPSQYLLLKKDFKIVMWDVLTRDWEQERSPESCFERVRRKAGKGSIIVFHDSIKAKARMLPALQKTLEYYTGAGYRFESLQNYLR